MVDLVSGYLQVSGADQVIGLIISNLRVPIRYKNLSRILTLLESQTKVQLVIRNTAITNLNCRAIVVPFLVPSPTFTWDSVKIF